MDDNDANLVALEALLEGMGLTLVRATSGEQALKAAKQDHFAAVLMDVHMPGMSGLEAARYLRQDSATSNTPIIFVTAADEAYWAMHEAYKLGAVDFLSKPLIPEVLRSKIAVFERLYRREDELRRQTAFLKAVLEAVQDAIVACDPNGSIILFNRAARELQGVPPDGLPQENWAGSSILLDAAGVKRVRKQEMPLFRALAGESISGAELTVLSGDGTRHSVLASAHPLRAQDGTALGAVVSMHDVTAQQEADAARRLALLEQSKRADAEALAERLRASEERLRKNEAELTRLAAELTAAAQRKNEFLATLAHELRNPMAPLRNALQLLKSPDLVDEDRAQALKIMDRQSKVLMRLIDDLLEVARITSGKIELRKHLIDLRQAVHSAVETTIHLLRERGHEFHLTLPDSPVPVLADSTRLAQVVSNLLNNAAKYTPPGGRIDLSLTTDAGNAVLQVRDTGVGLTEEAREKIFGMFEQVSESIGYAEGGLGIGLSLVRRLVELHGGSVSAISEGIGRGSTFTVRLPLEPSLAASAVEKPVAAAEAPAIDSEGLRILIMDDNVDAAETLASLLELEGHEVRTVHNSAQAPAVAREFVPDVAFLDLGMPGLSGFEVAKALRADPELQATRLVALTGWGAAGDRDRTSTAGFHHHLTKPVNLEELRSILSTVASEFRRV